MKTLRQWWVLAGLLAVTAVAVYAVWVVPSGMPDVAPGPDFKRPNRPHMDHSAIVQVPFATPQEVTENCLSCHPDAATEVMATSHWTWLGDEVQVPGHDKPMRIGKKNLLNNFCLGIQGNWASCTKCHAGYGWSSPDFDFSDRRNVDCLVCHERSGSYVKDQSGMPKPGTNLLAAAQSVGYPTRVNCGVCHSFGGGGLGVKHGDMDDSLNFPREEGDVHMGKHNLLCIDCHKTQKHDIAGRSMAVNVSFTNKIDCTDCHTQPPHTDKRLNAHIDSVACQTCHIPAFARRVPTKVDWDWSKAGDGSRPDDPHHYLRIKGEFKYDQDIVPEYKWWNRTVSRYIMGDKIDPGQVTRINYPLGSKDDASSKIYPFKVHTGKQPYDVEYSYLLQPVTSGEGGFWHEFDWHRALALGAEQTGTKFSGKYGFASTIMYWPLSHMVTTKDQALTCDHCHGSTSRMDWKALGYTHDPIRGGGRK